MDWVCAECGRAHDEPPAQCVCGSADVGPVEPEPPAYVRAYRRFVDPSTRGGMLVTDSPAVTVLFYLLCAFALFVAVAVALSAL